MAAVLHEFGQECVDVRDIGHATAADEVLAAHAKAHGLVLLSADFDLADVRAYPPAEYHGIVVLAIPERATVAFIENMLRGFLRDKTFTGGLPQSLVIVDAMRIRRRQ